MRSVTLILSMCPQYLWKRAYPNSIDRGGNWGSLKFGESVILIWGIKAKLLGHRAGIQISVPLILKPMVCRGMSASKKLTSRDREKVNSHHQRLYPWRGPWGTRQKSRADDSVKFVCLFVSWVLGLVLIANCHKALRRAANKAVLCTVQATVTPHLQAGVINLESKTRE